MINGVTFGTKHSFYDFGLILSQKDIGLPEPKTESVSVIGRDGDIDLTDALGDGVKFGNRKLQFVFYLVKNAGNWADALSRLSNYLHGKKMKIILDADKSFYYLGRCSINKFKTEKSISVITIDCDAEPYKYEMNVRELTINDTVTINLTNLAKIVSPTFECSSPMTITHNENTYEIPAGKNTIYDIRLHEGDNYITIEGNGTVIISYLGGSL